MENQELFQAKGLVKAFAGRTVVFNVEMEILRGEVVGLLGPNGAGKTTSFYMMAGLIKADQGIITINGEDITRWPIHKRVKKGLSYLPQEASIFRDLTVEENINGVLEICHTSRGKMNFWLEKLLDELNLKHIRKSKGRTLSGGERRRVEIARALAIHPSFILLDEPFAGVDPLAVKEIQNIINDLKDRNIGVLITDHNVKETLEIVDRAYIMIGGKLLTSGTPEQIMKDHKAKELYLGNSLESIQKRMQTGIKEDKRDEETH